MPALAGIFTGGDPVADRVIAVGDALDGSTVSGFDPLSFASSLNNAGQIAFLVRLADGRTAVYRADPKTGQLDKVFDDTDGPNGICFSPDYKKVYLADTGTARQIWVFDLDGKAIRNGKRFIQLDIPGTGAPSAADGIRCDVDGNIWAGARPGVQVITPAGERIGMIRMPETCANVCFGGTKRNRLFMAGSQSLYAVYVDTQGAHIA